MEPVSPGTTTVRAAVPMATITRYALDLRSLTKGRGRFRASMSHYDEMPHNEVESLVKAYEASKSGGDDH